MLALTHEEATVAPGSGQSAGRRAREGKLGPVTELTASECHLALASIHARLAELTASPKPSADEELTREQAAELVGEPSADRLFRRGIWERARVKTHAKKPLYSKRKLLAIMAERDRQSGIAFARGLRLVV